MKILTLFICLTMFACSSPVQGPDPVQDAGSDAATSCYPTNGTVRLACETGCGEMYRMYQRSGGADAGLYFNYTECLNECGCDEWPDGGNGQ